MTGARTTRTDASPFGTTFLRETVDEQTDEETFQGVPRVRGTPVCVSAPFVSRTPRRIVLNMA
jgi:hypothetical protein